MANTNFEAGLGITFIILRFLAIVGWVANLIQFVMVLGDNAITTMFIAKAVGIVIAPLGVVLGWIGIF